MPGSRKTHYRTVWLSDIHLGTKFCRVERLVQFLKAVRCDCLYLVGDIIDVWSMRRKWHWPKDHTEVVRRILKRDLKGTRIIFVPGNHDELFRAYHGLQFGGVEIRNEVIHTTADGRKALVVHGDVFDAIVRHHRLITMVGDWLYDVLLAVNVHFNTLRRWMGFGHWSLSNYVKQRVKKVISFISSFEEALARYARQKQVSVVVCGHIHHPELRDVDGIQYANCGDWVENCSAVVEHHDGRLEMLRFGPEGPMPAVLEDDEPAPTEDPHADLIEPMIVSLAVSPAAAGSPS
ncbi:MAG: UDP-2,3-diacylglucosamine diphosphatase [Planctomycetes bacterium]|nr:UDP-2,3-diacylglucosamine diphosphatase [Planctomycetota bacterium]